MRFNELSDLVFFGCVKLEDKLRYDSNKRTQDFKIKNMMVRSSKK